MITKSIQYISRRKTHTEHCRKIFAYFCPLPGRGRSPSATKLDTVLVRTIFFTLAFINIFAVKVWYAVREC